MKLNWLKLFKKFYYGITGRGAKKPPPTLPPSPCQIGLIFQTQYKQNLSTLSFNKDIANKVFDSAAAGSFFVKF